MPNAYLEKKRNHFKKVNDGTLEQNMRMVDLIFHNPPGPPLREKKTNVSKSKESQESEVIESQNEEAVDDVAPKEATEEEDSCIAPKVMIGPDGNLILDEQSLVFKTQEQKEMEANKGKRCVVEVDADDLGHGRFAKKRKKSLEWTRKETGRFYKALAVVGTDFSVMASVFTWRTRAELKHKFKKEELKNKHLVELALRDCTQFDFSIFDDSDYDHAEDIKTWKEDKKKKPKKTEDKALKREQAKLKKADQKKEDTKRKQALRSRFKKRKPRKLAPIVDDDSEDSDVSNTASITIDPQEVTFEVVVSSKTDDHGYPEETLELVERPLDNNDSATEESPEIENHNNDDADMEVPVDNIISESDGINDLQDQRQDPDELQNITIPPTATHVVLPETEKEETVYKKVAVNKLKKEELLYRSAKKLYRK